MTTDTVAHTAEPVESPGLLPAGTGRAGICRVCGCTDADCSDCIAATGQPCTWAAPSLCSRCAPTARAPR